MTLFTLTDPSSTTSTGETPLAFAVELNKAWLYLVPEFAALLKRDKGSKGDYRGEKKLKATREFTFIYFDLDFTSPIREWEEEERRAEALRMAGLTPEDLDPLVMAAHAQYNIMLMKSSRSLRTLRAVEKSLDQLDKYYEGLDFSLKDKKGELVHKPEAYLMNLKRLNEGYDALDAFRKRVEAELKGPTSIRGNAKLGRKEGKRTEWHEGSAPTSTKLPTTTSTGYMDIASILQGDEMEDEDVPRDPQDTEEEGEGELETAQPGN